MSAASHYALCVSELLSTNQSRFKEFLQAVLREIHSLKQSMRLRVAWERQRVSRLHRIELLMEPTHESVRLTRGIFWGGMLKTFSTVLVMFGFTHVERVHFFTLVSRTVR
jgi:hypothetical protein